MFSLVRRISPLAYLGFATLLVAGLLAGGRAPGAGELFVPPMDKLAHFVVFGGLAFLLVSGFRGSRALLAFALVVMAGLADEGQQFFIPGRHADWGDLAADVLAAAAGCYLTWRIWRGAAHA